MPQVGLLLEDPDGTLIEMVEPIKFLLWKKWAGIST